MTREHEGANDGSLQDDALAEARREAGDRLRERIYATFTALAVLVALSSHAEPFEPLSSVVTLIVSVVGVVLAGLASDLIAHMIAYDSLPTRHGFLQTLTVAARALTVLAAPVVVLLISVAGVIPERVAVTIALLFLIVSLAVIVMIAVQSTGLSVGKRVLVLAGIVLLGVAVVLLEQLAH